MEAATEAVNCLEPKQI
jgi:dynein heavy chain